MREKLAVARYEYDKELRERKHFSPLVEAKQIDDWLDLHYLAIRSFYTSNNTYVVSLVGRDDGSQTAIVTVTDKHFITALCSCISKYIVKRDC